MKTVLHLITENDAARILSHHLRGKIGEWRTTLEIDRWAGPECAIRWEGTPEKPMYAKHDVYEYVYATLRERNFVTWSVEAEFDNEIGYPRVQLSLSRGVESVWAALDPEEAVQLADQLRSMADSLDGMDIRRARQMMKDSDDVCPSPSDATSNGIEAAGGSEAGTGYVAETVERVEVIREDAWVEEEQRQALRDCPEQFEEVEREVFVDG
jgi:hypothetical protein